MKNFIKFLVMVVLAGALLVGLLSAGGTLYVRNPLASVAWEKGDISGGGAVYWKPFSNEYIVELDQGLDFRIWAVIDRAAEIVASPKMPTRIVGLFLIPRGYPDPKDEQDAEPEWSSAFSKSVVTFDDGDFRCKVEF